MSGKNFNDVMAYWGGKDKVAPKPMRHLSKKAPPKPVQQQQSEIPATTTATIITPSPPVVIVINNYNNVNTVNNNNNNNEISTTISPDTTDAKQPQLQEILQPQESVQINPYGNFEGNPTPIKNKYDNQMDEGKDVHVNSYNSSNYGGSSGVPTNNSYGSQYGGSQYGGSQYGGSNFYGGSGNDSERGKAYLLDGDDEDDDYYEENEENEDSDFKKSYNERDISETDLTKLEFMLINNSRDLTNNFIQPQSSDPKIIDENQSEKEQQIFSNPYISNSLPSIITSSSYKDAKFLLSDSTKSLNSSSNNNNTTKGQKTGDNVETLTSWNSEFQKLIEMDDCLEKFERLSSLEHDFVYAAETYGRIIISEHFLPTEFRTIKPVTVGGIAGGEKYIVQGILFKFAVENETFGLYGNDENAMKTAAHELNGCTSFLNVGIKGLHVPLMSYIDYRGFRLVAMSLLPISKKSLVYGSSDAGQTVHTSNTLFNHLFTSCAKIVNLKSHIVQDSSGDFKSIHGPIDIEGHIGTDNRFYLLDFARLSPPEPPSHRGSYLYKLLRLEFVRGYDKPLCSDAFSPMVNIDIENHNSEVKDAYNHLLNVIIPKFSETIDDKNGKGTLYGLDSFSKLLHQEGINVRLIGHVYKEVKKFDSKIFLVLEAVIRTLKSLARELLRREMKKIRLPSDHPYKSKILNFLNLIFGEYKGETEEFWEKILVEKLLKKFKGMEVESTVPSEPLILQDYKLESGKGKIKHCQSVLDFIKIVILKSDYLRDCVFKGFITSIGLKVTETVLSEFRYQSGSGFLFVDPDILELTTIITRLNIIDYADGMSLYYKSMKLKENSKAKQRLLSISKSRLEQSLSSMSTNYFAIYQLGNVIRLMSKFHSSDEEIVKTLDLAESTYKSIERFRIDPHLLFQTKLSRAKVSYAKIITRYDQNALPFLIEIANDFKENYTSYKNYLYPSYLVGKALMLRANMETEKEEAIQHFKDLIKETPTDYKSHLRLAKFMILSITPHTDEIEAEIRHHLSTAIEGNPALVSKLDSVIQSKCWIVFPYAESNENLKKEIRLHFSKTTDKLVVPKTTVIQDSDSYYFEEIKVDKLTVIDSQSSETIVNLLKFFGERISNLNISKSGDPTYKIPYSLRKLSNNLVKLNLGGCESIDDNILHDITTPLLRKLKLFNNTKISDISIENIKGVCPEIEHLDLGGCSLISDQPLKEIAIKCPNIKSLALPPLVSTDIVTEILSTLKSLVRLDLLGCKHVDRVLTKTGFELCESLVKLREANGIPHFTMLANTSLSLKNLSTFAHATETTHIGTYQNHERFISVQIIYRKQPYLVRTIVIWLHKNHHLVKFRDSPLDCNSNGYLRVASFERAEKPMQTLIIHQPIKTNAFNQPVKNIMYPSLVGSFLLNFSYDFNHYLINCRLLGAANSAYASHFSEDGITRAQVTNQRTNRHTVDFDFIRPVRFISVCVLFAASHD